MAEVVITINRRDYRINCDEGQEDRLRRLAQYIDDQIAELIEGVGNVGDVRLFVMASLVIADKLFDAIAETERLRAQVAQAKQSGAGAGAGAGVGVGESEAAMASVVEAIARRIDDIAARLDAA